MEGKSTREAERILAAEFPEQKPRETVRALNEEESKLTIVLSKKDLALLQALKEELSHSRPHVSNSEIFSYLLQKHRKIRRRTGGALPTQKSWRSFELVGDASSKTK